jgi:hypothetical protein
MMNRMDSPQLFNSFLSALVYRMNRNDWLIEQTFRRLFSRTGVNSCLSWWFAGRTGWGSTTRRRWRPSPRRRRSKRPRNGKGTDCEYGSALFFEAGSGSISALEWQAGSGLKAEERKRYRREVYPYIQSCGDRSALFFEAGSGSRSALKWQAGSGSSFALEWKDGSGSSFALEWKVGSGSSFALEWKAGSGSRSAFQWNAGSGSALKSKLKALKAPNRAVEGRGRPQWRHGGSKWSPGGSIDQRLQILITDEEQDPDPVPHWSEKLIRIRFRIKMKSLLGSALKWCGSSTLLISELFFAGDSVYYPTDIRCGCF